MSIQRLSSSAVPVRPSQGPRPTAPTLPGPAGPNAKGGPSFTDVLTSVINDASEVQDTHAAALDAFLRGEPIELHEVMAAAEEAGLALEMIVEFRNKFIEAYRTLVNMQ